MVLENHPTLRHDANAGKKEVGGSAQLAFAHRFCQEFGPSVVETPRKLARGRRRTYYAIIPATRL
jgi:hypothetical protein